jgi:hypothetical protein|tara:strand:- start:1588 stop:1839 length:252 start_codon:yes stop_codon:yes gene_type:complete
MKPFNTNADEILTEGQEYDIGQNDGKIFSRVIFKGTKNFCGKNMMCFEDQNGSQITVNVSYNSFTIEENGQFPMPEDLIKGDK